MLCAIIVSPASQSAATTRGGRHGRRGSPARSFSDLFSPAALGSQVRSVTRKHALVSLPGSLVGKVVRSEVLDVPLPDQATVADDDDDDGDGDDGADTAAAPPSPKSWLHVGQLVRCVVLSTHKGTGSGAGATGGKQIELSVRPSNVNKGRVTCAVFSPSHACPVGCRGGLGHISACRGAVMFTPGSW